MVEADTEARTLALAAYAGLVGVLAAPLTRRHLPGSHSSAPRPLLAVVATGYSTDLEATAMALTIVGTAICLVAVTHP